MSCSARKVMKLQIDRCSLIVHTFPYKVRNILILFSFTSQPESIIYHSTYTRHDFSAVQFIINCTWYDMVIGVIWTSSLNWRRLVQNTDIGSRGAEIPTNTPFANQSASSEAHANTAEDWWSSGNFGSKTRPSSHPIEKKHIESTGKCKIKNTLWFSQMT